MTQDNQRKTSGPTSVRKTIGAKAIKKKSWTREEWTSRAKEAGIENPDRLTVRGIRAQLKRLKNEGKIEDKRKNNGGHENGGRKPLDETERAKTATEMFEVHMTEIVDVVIHDKNAGTFTSKKVTTLQAMLDKLRQKGLQEGDVRAIVAYMDRVIGKPKQMVEHSGAIKQEEQRIPTEAERRAAKAYLAELDR